LEYLTKREELFSNKTVTIMPGEENNFTLEATDQFFEYTEQEYKHLEKQFILISGSEHDLLATYLTTSRTFSKTFHDKGYNGMLIQIDGTWQNFIKSQEKLNKDKSDKASYFLDNLVKKEVLKHYNQNSNELATVLMSFTRFDRRIISSNFMKFYETYKNSKGNYFARRYTDFRGIGIIFCFYSPEMNENSVNRLLSLTLNSFSLYTNYKSRSMVLIATTQEFKQFKIGLAKEIEPFNIEEERQIRELVKSLGWFTNVEEISATDWEFPP
jgi:hypothetical protein